MFELVKDSQNSPLPLVQCCSKSEKAMPGGGGQANLKPTLAERASLTVFVTDCRLLNSFVS